MHNLKKNMYTSNIYYMNPVSRDFPTHELVEVLFLKQYGFGISFYYIVSDEIPGFFLLLKKSYLHRAQWRNYFYLSRVRILVSPWLLTWFDFDFETENISIVFISPL